MMGWAHQDYRGAPPNRAAVRSLASPAGSLDDDASALDRQTVGGEAVLRCDRSM